MAPEIFYLKSKISEPKKAKSKLKEIFYNDNKTTHDNKVDNKNIHYKQKSPLKSIFYANGSKLKPLRKKINKVEEVER
jgi:hypothetical protein